MPKYIEVGRDVIEFPDSMSDKDIQVALQKQFPPQQPVAAAPAAPTSPAQRSFWEEAGRQLGLTVRAGITGVAGIPTMLAEPIAPIVNTVAGRTVIPLGASQALQTTLTKLGLPEPETKLERIAQTGASTVAGVGAQAQAAKAVGSQLLAPLAKEVPQQAVAAGAASTAAQATSERAKEVGFSPVEDAAASLAVGTLAGLAAGKAFRASTAEKTPPVTMNQVKAEARTAYDKVDNAGITVKPQPVLNTIDNIEQDLVANANFNPQLDAHRPVKTILDQMRQMVGQQRVSFSKLDQLRQSANDLARESTDAATRRLASIVVDKLDSKIVQLQPNELITGQGALQGALKDIKDARDAWRRVSKASVLDRALNISEARALDPKASEGELIRSQFKQLAANPEKMRMFSKEEQGAIRRIVSGSGAENLLSFMARFNPERSQLVAGGYLAAGTQAPMSSAAIAGAGFTADKSLGALQRRAAQDVISQILSGRITPPRDTASWRALVEAQAKSYGEQPKE